MVEERALVDDDGTAALALSLAMDPVNDKGGCGRGTGCGEGATELGWGARRGWGVDDDDALFAVLAMRSQGWEDFAVTLGLPSPGTSTVFG